jgi:hypothetical protein
MKPAVRAEPTSTGAALAAKNFGRAARKTVFNFDLLINLPFETIFSMNSYYADFVGYCNRAGALKGILY